MKVGADERSVFSATELAARWGLDVKTIHEAIAQEQIPSFRIGRRVLIPREAVEKLEQGRVLPDRTK